MSYYSSALPEEDLKKRVADDWFAGGGEFSTRGKVDFCILPKKLKGGLGKEENPLLWAEAKAGVSHDIVGSFVQLILTIGRRTAAGRIVDDDNTPPFIGAFDAEKFAFVPFETIEYIFDKNDFDWTVTPSDHSSKEFQEIKRLLEETLEKCQTLFLYDQQGDELKRFIQNGLEKRRTSRQQITDRNFVRIFHKWEAHVLPSIDVVWKNASGILPRDFFLADLLSENGVGLVENLFVILKSDKYERRLESRNLGSDYAFVQYAFNDGQKAYSAFWNIYRRPPRHEFWNSIMERVDLLVPSEYRERKGAFFTPAIWVRKSQEYLASALGEEWQENYYVWDCCAGTGNLEVGLRKPLRVWASTLDEADVKIMREVCRQDGNYAREHIFRFDFLNDSFDSLPEGLRNVLRDEGKRRRLVIYINPPYAEAANARQANGNGQNREGVAIKHKVYEPARKCIGPAALELFAQFLYRIYTEIPDCIIGHFSTLKHLQGQNFARFRDFFLADLKRMFIVPANTFDNVCGQFPIGFFIWDTSVKKQFTEINAEVFDANDIPLGNKHICRVDSFIIEWLRQYYDNTQMQLGYLRMLGCDIQNNNGVFLTSKLSANDIKEKKYTTLTAGNIVPMCIYFTVRHCVDHTWLNDRDQYLWPNDGWKTDLEFQSDCLAYTLFHGQNRISCKDGVNHWIPFAAEEVGASDEFESSFMCDFIGGTAKGTAKGMTQPELAFEGMTKLAAEAQADYDTVALTFSPEAQAVMDVGREVWRHYHSRKVSGFGKYFPYRLNASFYDIREFFQGRKGGATGTMNSDSPDAAYTSLIGELRGRMEILGQKLVAKVYEYGFLLK